jgi:hypothetical protein
MDKECHSGLVLYGIVELSCRSLKKVKYRRGEAVFSVVPALSI